MTHRERAGELAGWIHRLVRRSCHGRGLPPEAGRELVDALEQLQDEAVSLYANTVGVA